MAKGICNILIPKPFDESFALIESKWEQLGVTIENPSNGRVTTCTDEGEQLHTNVAQIISGALAGIVRNVQFWKSDNEDVFVSWKEVSDGWQFSFFLNGLASDFAKEISVHFLKFVLEEFSGSYAETVAFSIEYE